MAKITINGREVEFKPGQVILQAANEAGIEVPQYCYHEGLSIVASCRICLAEVWMPDRTTGKLVPHMGGKLMPTCQTAAMEGMVVYTDSPKSVANQKAVMEYLLINHPLDCPVCDQAGECLLQDYSYEYGRGVSRFEEMKVKQPKKDLGPHVYLYADRCIMCSRCVRFTREVSGTSELCVTGRGNRNEIDVFPGAALDNELSANVVDLCPVGALLDKDFLFAQRVWFLKSTPSIDPITASGDNILIEHNEGKVYRLKPRTNMSVNKWWMTDEVRFGWKFVHSEQRLKTPLRRQFGVLVEAEYARVVRDAAEGLRRARAAGEATTALLVSPMLSCEDAYTLAKACLEIDAGCLLGVGPVPVRGEDRVYPPGDANGYRVYAEKCPNRRGVERVLEGLRPRGWLAYAEWAKKVGGRTGVVVTGNYPDAWADEGLLTALGGAFVVVIDTVESRLTDRADVLIPAATWAEKAGCFENARGMVQAFEKAIPFVGAATPEAQIGLDLGAAARSEAVGAVGYNAAEVRARMSESGAGLGVFAAEVRPAVMSVRQEADMEVVEL